VDARLCGSSRRHDKRYPALAINKDAAEDGRCTMLTLLAVCLNSWVGWNSVEIAASHDQARTPPNPTGAH
jgi:hypothetical protein